MYIDVCARDTLNGIIFYLVSFYSIGNFSRDGLISFDSFRCFVVCACVTRKVKSKWALPKSFRCETKAVQIVIERCHLCNLIPFKAMLWFAFFLLLNEFQKKWNAMQKVLFAANCNFSHFVGTVDIRLASIIIFFSLFRLHVIGFPFCSSLDIRIFPAIFFSSKIFRHSKPEHV